MRIKKYKLPKEFWIFLILVILSVLISLRSSVFYRPDNLVDLIKGGTVLGICSLGMLFVVVSGGIDVSISAVIAVSASLMGNYMFYLKDSIFNNIYMVFIVCIISGAALGAINGILIGKFKVPAIVATLGTLALIKGGLFLITGGNWVNRFDLPEWIVIFGRRTLFGIPVQIIVFIVMIIISWLLIKYTRFGRSAYAIGGNSVSAMRIGINVERTLLYVYILMGIYTGVAAFVHTSVMIQVDPNSFSGLEFKVIAAVFIGGAAFGGGRGSVLGIVLGVVLLSVLNNGMIIARIPVFWQQILTGVVIIAAVTFDTIQRQRIEKRLLKIDVE
jgi:ribose/xylose/arabinose/galactoside ABC-type transport system permease subunit